MGTVKGFHDRRRRQNSSGSLPPGARSGGWTVPLHHNVNDAKMYQSSPPFLVQPPMAVTLRDHVYLTVIMYDIHKNVHIYNTFCLIRHNMKFDTILVTDSRNRGIEIITQVEQISFKSV